MRKACFLLVSLALACAVRAQTGTIKGWVKDVDNGIPLNGVSIYLTDRTMGSTSNQLGAFVLPQVAVGMYQVDVSHTGYETALLTVEVKKGETSELAINLKKNILQLQDVLVSGKTNPAKSISAIDIQLRPINNSQDILRMVPGLFIAQHAGGGKAEQIFLRGYDLDHGTDINISVDGMPVNMVSHAHGQGYADLHFLIPEMVEKVQFEKGPYNPQYGNLATSSYVAFSTPDFLKDQFVKTEFGQFNTLRFASAIKLLEKQKEQHHQQWYAAGEYSLTDGFFDKPQNFNRYNVFTKYSASLGSKTFLSLSASTFGSRWDASGQIPQRAVDMGLISRYGSIDSTEAGNTSRTNINLLLQQQLNNQWTSSNRLYYSHYHFNLYSNFTFFLNYPTQGDEIQQWEDRHLAGYNGSLDYNGSIGNKRYQSELGYGFRYDAVNNSQLNHVEKQVFISTLQEGDIREANLFAYWNNTIDLTHRLQLNASLRYDWFRFAYKNLLATNQSFDHQNRGVVSPKLNLSYTANQTIKLFLSSGIGFHSNDTRVILQQQADKILPRVFGTDAGIIIKPARALLMKAVIWWLYSEQEFVYVGDAGIVEPSGETRRYGLDLMLRYQPLQWLYADFDLNLTNARLVDASKGEDHVPLAASVTSMGGLTAKTKKGWSGSLRYRAIGTRPANEDNSVQADGYFLLDAVVSYRLKKFEFSLSAQNLLNREWKEAQFDTESRLSFETNPVSEIHYTPGTPRFLKAGIGFHF
jgi:outer membrane cobalamin receptor